MLNVSKLQTRRLSSGLGLVVYPIRSTKFIEIALGIGVGTRYEPEHLAGIAHFVEHILFRGCEKFQTSFELNRTFDSISDGLNAFTHKEYTVYQTRVFHDALKPAIEAIASVVGEPLFKDVDIERGIILEELLEDLDEQGRQASLENIARKLTFGNHSLGRNVLGTKSSLKRIQLEDLKYFHSQFYQPNNMVLVLCGDIRIEKIATHIDRIFLDIFGRRTFRSSKPVFGEDYVEVKHTKNRIEFITDPSASQAEVLMTFRAPGERRPGVLERMFLSRILDDGLSSRLQRKVSEQRGLVYNISTSIEAFTDVSLFDIEFTVSKKKLTTVISAIFEELQDLRRQKISEDEFNHVKRRFEHDVLATSENARAMSQVLAEAFTLKLPFPVDPAEYIGQLQHLTREKILREARRLFQANAFSLYIKGPRLTAKQKSDIQCLEL